MRIKPIDETGRYHAFDPTSGWYLENASDRELEKWAADPNCLEQEACAAALQARRAKSNQQETVFEQAEAPQGVTAPFDPRTEISADARHIANRIVNHLWIIFVLLPIFIFFALLIIGTVRLG